MQKQNNIKKNYPLKSMGLALLLLSGLSARADSFYNSTNYNGNTFTLGNNQEIGNEIFLTGSSFSLTNFTFEYRSTSGSFPGGSVGVDVRFYLNDGAPTNGFATPASLFYDSGWFYGVTPATVGQDISYDTSDLYSGSTLNLTPGFVMPSDFTFTITFTNLVGGNGVELPLADPLSGQSGDYWLETADGWELLTNSVPSSFIANFSGTAVPEPPVLSLCVAGGALLVLGVIRQRKHQKRIVKGE
jgi:hypothetical protein